MMLLITSADKRPKYIFVSCFTAKPVFKEKITNYICLFKKYPGLSIPVVKPWSNLAANQKGHIQHSPVRLFNWKWDTSK